MQYLLLFLSLLVLTLVGLPRYKEMRDKAYEREALVILESAFSSLQKKPGGRFPNSLADCADFNLTNEHFFSIYDNVHNLPLSYSKIIPESFRPYINDEGFLILIAQRDHPNGIYKFCKIDNQHVIECVSILRTY